MPTMVWKHQISAGHLSPLEPDRQVFGSKEGGYFIITGYQYGSHWKMRAVDACALTQGNLEPILTHRAKELHDSATWRCARDIWPEHYVEVKLLSPCCNAKLDGSRGDGVMIGSCSKCNKDIVRLNPDTGVQEWLDGQSPWTKEALRPVAVVEKVAEAA